MTAQSEQCPVCSKQGHPHFYTKDYNRRTSGQTFVYHLCSECGLLFLMPVPANLGSYYPSEYYSLPKSLVELDAMAKPEQFKIEMVRRFATGGHLVDIGANTGSFVHLAKMSGFRVDAIEMDGNCCKFLSDVVGVNAICAADVVKGLSQVDCCDVITLWHVLEHLPKWLHVLKAAGTKLRTKGILLIAAPNPDAFQYRVFGSHWAHIDAPRHLQLIPLSLLIREMNMLNLQQVMLTTTDKGSLGYNEFGWGMSLKTYFTFKPFRFGAYLVGRVIAGLLIPLERADVFGSSYTIVFQKN